MTARNASPARRMDTLVEIQNPPSATTQDEFGSVDVVGGWTRYDVAWVSIIPTHSEPEPIRGGKTVAIQHFAIGMRRRSDLNYQQRLKVLGTGMYAGAILNFNGPPASDGSPRSATITIMAKQGQP